MSCIGKIWKTLKKIRTTQSMCGYSLVAGRKLPKLLARVQIPLAAPPNRIFQILYGE